MEDWSIRVHPNSVLVSINLLIISLILSKIQNDLQYNMTIQIKCVLESCFAYFFQNVGMLFAFLQESKLQFGDGFWAFAAEFMENYE